MKPITSVENMRKSDAYTIEHAVSGIELMHRASMGIYNSVSWHGRVGIACGSGNNAGDGYALALILKEHGICPDIILLKEKFSADAKYYFDKCKQEKIPVYLYDSTTSLCGYDIVVDCLLGTGFFGQVEGQMREVIEKINESGAYVVSADINSGLCGDNGMCSVAVKSDLTVSIGTIKSGHILNQAKDYIGEIKNVDIGIELIDAPYHLIEAKDCLSRLKPRKAFSHKGTYGYATLIGGCTEYSGAIRLASMAQGALRSGLGVARVATARSLCPVLTPHLLEATLYPMSDINGSIVYNPTELDGALQGARAVAIGMGIGKDAQAYELIEHILKGYEMPVIIDADGLNALSRGSLDILKDTKCTPILTPHPAELSRLSGLSVAEIVNNPIRSALDFARKYDVIVLLKGTATVITDGKEVYITNTGCAGMASAGSGDVLSGVMLAFCSQFPSPTEQIVNAYVASYINGRAGEIAGKRLGQISMLASDTVASLPQAILEITNE